MADPKTLRFQIDLPVTGTERSRRKPHIDFNFEGIAKEIEKATGLPVDICYGHTEQPPKVAQVKVDPK